MELSEVIKARRSIRKFKSDPVPDEAIKELLEAARLAPSGLNVQPWRFVVVKSAEARANLRQGTPLPFIPEAPVVIACCVDKQALAQTGQRMKELQEAGALAPSPAGSPDSEALSRRSNMDEAAAKAYLSLNEAIAVEHIVLKAVDLGLGTCWAMMFDRDKIKEVLGLEDRYDVLVLLPVGYPDQDPAPRPRLPLAELVIKEV